MTLIFITPCPKSTYSHVCVCVYSLSLLLCSPSMDLRDPTTRKTLLHYSSINLAACLKPQRVFAPMSLSSWWLCIVKSFIVKGIAFQLISTDLFGTDFLSPWIILFNIFIGFEKEGMSNNRVCISLIWLFKINLW